MGTKVVLRRTSKGQYATPDGRFTVSEAFDPSTATRGRGERYWVLSDTTGQSGPPSFVATLALARESIERALRTSDRPAAA